MRLDAAKAFGHDRPGVPPLSATDATSASAAAPSHGLYTRQSSGLVRDISPLSNAVLNISFVSIPLAVFVATQAPYAFPGASPFWVTLICVAVCVLPVMLYSLFMAVMPRSGGDYVFVSRTLHPWLGFAANFNIVAWYVLVIAYFAYLLGPSALGTAFVSIGVAAGSHTFTNWGNTLATSHAWQFGIGAVTLVLCAAMMTTNLRRILSIQQVLFWLSLVCVAISLVLLIFHGRGSFESAVAHFGGNYHGMISAARAQGFAGSAHFDFGNTLLAMPLAFASFGYAIVSSYAGSEVRAPGSKGSRAMMWALISSGVVTAILMLLAGRTFGNDFLGSATFLNYAGAKQYPFGAPSGFFFYVSMLTSSTPVIVILNLSVVVAYFVALPVTFLITTRSLFAWSFDRILPEKVSEVSPRTRSPLLATGIVLVVSLIYLALIVFGASSFLSLLYTAGMAELLTFMVVAIAGVVFPFRRRAMYEGSPINRTILGVPLLTLVGLGSLALYAFFFVSLATQDALGANASSGIRAVIIIAAIGILAYPISYFVNRRRGVDLGLAFRQLPPE
jgi:amino acid transporter